MLFEDDSMKSKNEVGVVPGIRISIHELIYGQLRRNGFPPASFATYLSSMILELEHSNAHEIGAADRFLSCAVFKFRCGVRIRWNSVGFGLGRFFCLFRLQAMQSAGTYGLLVGTQYSLHAE